MPLFLYLSLHRFYLYFRISFIVVDVVMYSLYFSQYILMLFSRHVLIKICAISSFSSFIFWSVERTDLLKYRPSTDPFSFLGLFKQAIHILQLINMKKLPYSIQP